MADVFQIKDRKGLYFLTLQVVGWADVLTRTIYRYLLNLHLNPIVML
jgi:hypothetical protein